MTAFHEYASVVPRSVQNMRSSQTLCSICRNWQLCAAGNETTVHCVLLIWRAWVVSRNLGNLLDMPLVQVFRVYVLSFVKGGPNFSEGVHILQYNKFWGSEFIEKLVPLVPGGTNFGGSIFTMTGYHVWCRNMFHSPQMSCLLELMIPSWVSLLVMSSSRPLIVVGYNVKYVYPVCDPCMGALVSL